MPLLLQELFVPGRIKCHLEAEDKSEAFEELVDALVTHYSLDCRDEILDAINRREAKMSTGIKKGIAIPHAKTAFTRGVIGVLGISDRGIDYESMDGEPVRMLFLLVSSEEDAATHLSVLKKIALLVENPEFYRGGVRRRGPGESAPHHPRLRGDPRLAGRVAPGARGRNRYVMSDMLEKLIGVEKTAAALIAEAEADAARRTSQARSDAQKESAEILKKKAVELERTIEAEKNAISAERKRKTDAYRESLAQRAPDEKAFRRAAFDFIDKGSP